MGLHTSTPWDDPDDPTCRKCGGEGDIPVSKSSIIVGPDTEYTDRGFMVCPHCNGTGEEP